MIDTTEEKQRLLIVDDSKVIRVTARKILRDHFEVMEAVDGENAWEILTSAEPFTLVVSDLTMPKLDGFGLLERIRNSHLPHVREIPVIIITATDDTDVTMERARQTGATDFIGKPFDAVHLLARTQAHANSHAVTNTLKEENTALEDQSTVDPLTGLANETALMERGYQQLSFAIRHNSSLVMCRIEIDNYGEIFRKHGDSCCESIVKTMGNILSTDIRQEDTAARIGTARFALLLNGIDKTGIGNLTERINRETRALNITADDVRINVTLSMGIAAPEIRRETRLDELITVADRRLERATARGGNQIVFDATDAIPHQEAVTVSEPQAQSAKAHAAGFANVTEPPQADEITINPFEDNNAEIEEIELSAPFNFGDFDPVNDKTPGVESRSTEITEPAFNTFAGPVPELSVRVPAPETPAARTAPHPPQDSLVPSPSPAAEGPSAGVMEFKAADNTPQHNEGDIIIAAPFAAHPVAHPELPDSDEAEPAPKRKGLLRRALGLFRRSKSRT